MTRRILLFAALLAASAVVLNAQETPNDSAPLYGGTYTHIDGVFITPVTGSPFSATAVIESARPMPDGTAETKRSINVIARDSLGRIHNERRSLVPQSFHGTPQLIQVHLFDPQTRLSTFYEPATRVARQQVLPEPRKAANPTNPNVIVEDLGTRALNGLEAKGTRRTYTVAARSSGTGSPVQVVDEYWYSEDLHINLLVRHDDPRSGVQTVSVSEIQLEEPAPALFEVPQEYKIVDMTPPPGAPAANGVAVPGSSIR
jgi:hypothetical protein